VGSIDSRISVQGHPGQKCEILYEKITTTKRAGGMIQMIECLLSQCEAFKPHTPPHKKKKKKKEGRKQRQVYGTKILSKD
jgi:hypothetical protein